MKKSNQKNIKLTVEQKAKRKLRKQRQKQKKEIIKQRRKKARERGPNPYTSLRYHKGYVYDPVRYTVLTGILMPPERVEMVTSALKAITTGPEAMTLPENPGWACHAVGDHGRVYIVSYLGTEVALFFKRQVHELVPQPGDKTPEGVLQDPKEAWQRLDLLGRSAKKSNFVLVQSQSRLDQTNKVLKERMQTLDDLNDSLVQQIEHFKRLIISRDIEIRDSKKQMAVMARSIRALPKPTSNKKSSRGKPANGSSIRSTAHYKRIKSRKRSNEKM